jgi:hypothetical protein
MMPNLSVTAAEVPLAERQQWPKLSRMLGAKYPARCALCGIDVSDSPDGPTTGERCRWIEHDEWDRPTSAVVVLCTTCSDRVIKPHPRLYSAVPRHKPIPGLMELCVGCRHLDGARCTNPRARANGGEGVGVQVTPPTFAFLCVRNGSTSTREEIWPSAPSACDGREEDAPDA